MSQSPPSQQAREMTTSRVVSIVFACLACAVFFIGSIAICSLWFGVSTMGSPGSVMIITDGNDEGNLIATILTLLVMLFLFWLLGTVALLIARRWIAAALLLPITVVTFIGIYLFIVFVMYHVSGGPKIAFVLLFIPLDILLFGAAWRLILRGRYSHLDIKP